MAYKALCVPPVIPTKARRMMRRRDAYDAGAMLGIALAVLIAACSAFFLWAEFHKPRVTDADLLTGFVLFPLAVLGVVTLLWLLLPLHSVGRSALRRVYLDEETLAQGRPSRSGKLLEFTEMAKDFVLDVQISEADAWRPPQLDLPPLDVAQFKAAMGPKVEEFLKRAAEILDKNASGRSPAFRQLLRDFEHELREVARQVQLDTAMSRFPAPAGHWAERYRKIIEAEQRESQHHDRSPSHN